MDNILKQYFEFEEEYKKQYGEYTIIVIQTASYYSIFSINDDEKLAELKLLLGSQVNFYPRMKQDGIIKSFGEIRFRKSFLYKFAQILPCNGYPIIVFDYDDECANTYKEIMRSIPNNIKKKSVIVENKSVTIEKESVQEVKKVIADDDNTKNPECTICDNEIKNKIALVPCGHCTFCKPCIDKWKEKTCPTCRTEYAMVMNLYD